MYLCPKCRQPLLREDKRFLCSQNHSYDISKQGYVNLLLSSKIGCHGDNKEMIAARRDFLSLGYYSDIINKVADLISERAASSTIKILDAGCGEGYYTAGIKNELEKNGIIAEVYGIDVSKDALVFASKKYKDISFSVCSVNDLPFDDGVFDFVISLFAPLSEDEFCRILAPSGTLITVSPGEMHLFGLKRAVYKTPKPNPPSTFVTAKLKKDDEFSTLETVIINDQSIITNLFKMTPYYYKTSKTDAEKALSLTHLQTEISFTYAVYSK